MAPCPPDGLAALAEAPVLVLKYTKLFINGDFVDAISKETFETLDPRTGEVIASVAQADNEDVNAAVKAARKAFDEGPWPRMSGYERGRSLTKFSDLIEQHTQQLATLETLDNGKPLIMSTYADVPMTIKLLRSMAGLPPGVLNVLPGFGETAGAAMASHMDIDKISFTGSTEVGRLIMEAAAKSNLKQVTLELGGKSPLIVCNDADVDLAVEIAHSGGFTNMGQICIACSRLFVQEGIYDEFVKKMVARAQKNVIGDPFNPGVTHGPQVSQTQLETVLGYIESGKEEGAKLVTGGNRFGNQGCFVEPTIFADVQDSMKIAKEEIFGPVLCILKFETLEEAVERANATVYGLASGIVSKDMDVANRVSRCLRAGVVWLNCYLYLDPVLPFGGYKMSGFGREQGLQGVLNYMQLKSVVTPLHNSPWL